MRSSRFNQRNALILVIVLLIVSSLLPAAGADFVTIVPRNAIALFTTWPADKLNMVTGGIRSAPDQAVQIGTMEEVLAKNLALEAENGVLVEKLRELHATVRILQGLEAQANFSYTRFQMARARRGRAGRLILNKGSLSGVTPGLVVVNDAANLVGRVTHATTLNATVELISSTSSPLFVRMVDPRQTTSGELGTAAIARHRGEVQMQLRLAEDGKSFQGECPLRANVKKNYLAKLADDPSWPAEAQGFIVGIVTNVQPDPGDPNNFNLVTVKPIRHLPDLSRVVVLVPTDVE